MSTIDRPGPADATDADPAPLLWDGQRLDQPTFHELYLQTPDDFRAELIDGVVYTMSSPVSPDHAKPDADWAWFLKSYAIETPGTVVHVNGTTKLDHRSEVQPDSALLIRPSHGGRTGIDAKGYTTGSPELVVEVSFSTAKLDLTAKKLVYERAGALEYIVHEVARRAIHWFALDADRFQPLPLDDDGVHRSRAFPGLWLDAAAFLIDDGRAVLDRLRLGLASPEHADFVARLAQSRGNRP